MTAISEINGVNALTGIVRITPTESQKRMVAGRQGFKCANKPEVTLKGIETYQCPLWLKSDADNRGSFDQSGFDMDHIDELSQSGNNSLENFQALCKSCHCVKTKKFLMKKTNNIFHPIYGKLITKHGLHRVFLADSHIITMNSRQWSKNRPPDMMRVDEIAKYITSNGSVDGILYFANIPDEGLVCYDGNHRREALMKAEKSYKIFINVIEHPSDKYICEKFVSLNRCVPVTELYLDNMDTHNNMEHDGSQLKMKKSILELANHFSEIWKDHRKTSPKPRRPNFNFDSLQQKLKDILDKCMGGWESSNKRQLIDFINIHNNRIKSEIESNYNSNPNHKYTFTPRMIEKCQSSNCYLFL